MTSFFSAEGGPIWTKFRRLVQNDMSTAVMWPKSKPDVEFQYDGRLGEFSGMSSQSHVSHYRVLPLGDVTVTIPEPHATLQGVRIPFAILKIVFRHIFFLFLMQFRLWRAAALVSSPIHLLCITSSIKRLHLCRKLLQFEVDIITINRYHSQKISWVNTEYARANASFIHKIFKTTVVVCFY